MAWLCGEHALRALHRQATEIARYYRKHPDLQAPVIGVSLGLPPLWDRLDLDATRELKEKPEGFQEKNYVVTHHPAPRDDDG